MGCLRNTRGWLLRDGRVPVGYPHPKRRVATFDGSHGLQSMDRVRNTPTRRAATFELGSVSPACDGSGVATRREGGGLATPWTRSPRLSSQHRYARQPLREIACRRGSCPGAACITLLLSCVILPSSLPSAISGNAWISRCFLPRNIRDLQTRNSADCSRLRDLVHT